MMSRAVTLAAALSTLAGCDVGLTAVQFDCGPNEVPTDTGCALAGVPPESCLEAANGRGGCVMTYDEACEGLSLPDLGCQSLCTFVEDPARPGFPKAGLVDQLPAGPDSTPTPDGEPNYFFDFSTLPVVLTVGPEGDFATIQAAIDASDPTPEGEYPTLILVAPGSYEEDVFVDRPAVIWGSCPEQTQLVGQSVEGAALTFLDGATNSGVVGFGITGPGDGFHTLAGGSAALGFSRVDVEGFAVRFDAEAGGYTTRAILSGAKGGVHTAGSPVAVSRTVITDAPVGIVARASASGARPNLFVNRSVVVDMETNALRAEGVTVTLERSLLRGAGGIGVDVRRSTPFAVDADLKLRTCVIEGTHDAAVEASDAHVEITDTSIRDVRGRDDGLAFNAGCAGHGVRLLTGIDLPLSTLSTSSIERAQTAGLLVRGGELDVTSLLVRDTQPEACSGGFGDGLQLYEGTSAALDGVRVESSARAALALFGAAVSLESSAFTCSAHDLATETYGAGEPNLDELGANVCGCDGQWDRCRHAALGLAPWIQE